MVWWWFNFEYVCAQQKNRPTQALPLITKPTFNNVLQSMVFLPEVITFPLQSCNLFLAWLVVTLLFILSCCRRLSIWHWWQLEEDVHCILLLVLLHPVVLQCGARLIPGLSPLLGGWCERENGWNPVRGQRVIRFATYNDTRGFISNIFTFRAFSGRFYPKRLAISIFVKRRKQQYITDGTV